MSGNPSAAADEQPAGNGGRWSALLLVCLGAVATVVGIDRAFASRCPGVILPQVDDGVRLLAATNPVAIVLGSSQVRSFAAVDALVAERSGGRDRVVAVAVEDGRLSTAAWVLEHRLLPLITATDSRGQRQRDRLRRVLLVTDWYDSMVDRDGRASGDGFEARNLPARAWAAGDFVADVGQHGLTPFNKTFLTAAFEDLLRGSVLVRDRGYNLLVRYLRTGRLEMSEADHRRLIADKRFSIEAAAPDVLAAAEMRALERICGLCRAAGLQLTIALYPALQETISERARAVTVEPFAQAAAAIAARHGVPFLDWTYTAPLQLEHFRDHAHLNQKGHEAFARWLLAGDLKDLEPKDGPR